MKNTLSVIIDHREPIEQCKYEFEKYHPAKLEIISLEIGDYFINSHLLFERKTMRDFIRSICDGRLFSQGRQLKFSKMKSAILLEGNGEDLANLNALRPAIQGAILKLSLGFGIPVLRSNHIAESVQLMVYAAYQRHTIGKMFMPPKKKITTCKYRTKLQLLQALPHVGLYRAKLLLRHFGNLRRVFNASYEELRHVPGIGKQIAGKIISILDSVKR